MYKCVENELHDTIFCCGIQVFTNFDSFVILVYIHVPSAGAEIVLEKWGGSNPRICHRRRRGRRG